MIEIKEKPQNEEVFDNLKILTKEILDSMYDKKIELIAYGSLIFFGYVKDQSLDVNDFDFLINEVDLANSIEVLKETGVSYEYHEEIHSIHIEENGVKIKIDSKDFLFKDENFSYENFNFGGLILKGLDIESLKKVYMIASKLSDIKSSENSLKYEILNRIKPSFSSNDQTNVS